MPDGFDVLNPVSLHICMYNIRIVFMCLHTYVQTVYIHIYIHMYRYIYIYITILPRVYWYIRACRIHIATSRRALWMPSQTYHRLDTSPITRVADKELKLSYHHDWTSKEANIRDLIPKRLGRWSIVLGTLEVQVGIYGK